MFLLFLKWLIIRSYPRLPSSNWTGSRPPQRSRSWLRSVFLNSRKFGTFLFFSVIFSNSKLHFVGYNWDLRNFRPFSKFACKFIAWVEESSEYVGRDSYGCQYSLQWNIRPLLIFHVLSEVCNEIWFDLINILLSLIVDLVFEPDPDYEQNIISWWHRLAGAAQFVMATCVVTDIQMESLP